MKKYVRIPLKIFACILIASNLTSCWSAHELNKLAFVMGVGIDKSKEKDKIQTTLQIAKVMSIKSSSGGINVSEESKNYLNLRGEGNTISEAVNSINHKLNRRIFFPHNQVIIFNKDVAEGGIEKYIDFFMRNRETRLLEWVLVSDGNTFEILNVKPELEITNGRSIGELIRSEKEISQVSAVDLKEFSQKLMSKTTAPVAPIISLSKEGLDGKLNISGTAVFNKDKMVGSLSNKETKGYLWGSGNMKQGIVTIDSPDNNGKITIQITKSKSKIVPQIKNGEINVTIKIDADGDLAEQTFSEDEASPKAFESLEKILQEVIKKDVIFSLDKAKELNADIFGFGDAIYRHYPKEWSKMESSWGEIYHNIKVDVSVNTKLRRTGRITKPIMSKEE